MADRDRFELDLAAALQTYLDEAPTEVRPTELARHFATDYPPGRTSISLRRFAAIPRPAWVLLLGAALLAALLGGALLAGSRLLERTPPLPARLPALLEGERTPPSRCGCPRSWRAWSPRRSNRGCCGSSTTACGTSRIRTILSDPRWTSPRMAAYGCRAMRAGRPVPPWPGTGVRGLHAGLLPGSRARWLALGHPGGYFIFSFDGEGWTERATKTDDSLSFGALAIGPDGTVWVTASDRDKYCSDTDSDDCVGTVLMRLEDDGSLTAIEGWADVYDGDVSPDELAVSPAGDVWLAGMVGGGCGWGSRGAAALRWQGVGAGPGS